MKVDLNYKLDEPNLNGRIYKKDVLMEAMERAIEVGLPVVEECVFDGLAENYELDLKKHKIIGEVEDFFVDDNMIKVGVKFNENANEIIKLIEDGTLVATTSGTGMVGADHKTIENFTLRSVFLTKDKIEEE